MSGEVRAPYVPLDNERIDRRHAHSVAMAAFFRWWFETTSTIKRTAGEFFLPGDGESDAPVTHVRGFLTPVPPGVRASSIGFFPPRSRRRSVSLRRWVDVLVDLLEPSVKS